jgi:hypothetical protein
VVLAYVTTIHKSQGSEYPAVTVSVLAQHYPTLQQNLLYTDLPGGKRLVVRCTHPTPLKANRLVGMSHGGNVRTRSHHGSNPSLKTRPHHLVIDGAASKLLEAIADPVKRLDHVKCDVDRPKF